MGSWNGTCGYSNLPIRAGEKVACFIVVEEDFSKWEKSNNLKDNIQKNIVTHDVYATSFRRPISLPFFGEYDDYGAVKNIEMSIHTRYLLQRFNESISSGNLKFNKYDFEKENFDSIEEVVNLVERGCWDICDDIINKYTLYMVHYDLYKNLVNVTKDLKTLKFVKTDLLLNLKRDSFLDFWKKVHADGDAEPDPIPSPSQEDLDFYEINEYKGEYPHLSHFISNEIRMKYLDIRSIDKWFNDLLHFYYFNELLIKTRKSYYMGSGAGSQSENYKIYQKAYKKIIKFNRKNIIKDKISSIKNFIWEFKYKINNFREKLSNI